MYKFGQDLVIDQSTMQNDRSHSSEARLKRRMEEDLKGKVADLIKQRGATDLASSGPIRIPLDLEEPFFQFDRETGNPSFVIVGNPIYRKGDIIEKPPGWTRASGRGRGASDSDDGGEDNFIFHICSEEVEDRLFEELELPNLEDRTLHRRTLESRQHAGYVSDGPPATLDLSRTMTRSIGRRIALRRPSLATLERLQLEIARIEALAENSPERSFLPELHEQLARIIRSRRAVPFLDRPDLQHRRSEIVTQPVTSAVVFALMDVSYSMDELLKELAKRFFWLLRRFLMREYDEVTMVWIRHTSIAEEVNERDFFFSQHTGGTCVSTSLEKMIDIQKDRFPLEMHNLYLCQATDGDAGILIQENARRPAKKKWGSYVGDAEYSAELLRHDILPIVQYAAYLECRHSLSGASGNMQTELWQAYDSLTTDHDHFVMRQVCEPSQIFPVFKNLFTPALIR